MQTLTHNKHATGMIAQKHIFQLLLVLELILIEPLPPQAHMVLKNSKTLLLSNMEDVHLTHLSSIQTMSKQLLDVP